MPKRNLFWKLELYFIFLALNCCFGLKLQKYFLWTDIENVTWYLHFCHAISIQYTLGIEAKNYMIKSTLNWLDLISVEKTCQTATVDKDNCTFSVVYS